jgi:hypothetical protein
MNLPPAFADPALLPLQFCRLDFTWPNIGNLPPASTALPKAPSFLILEFALLLKYA